MPNARFLGIGRRAEVDPAAAQSLAAQLFPPGELLAEDDLVAWYIALTDRIALVAAALEIARTRRAMVVAHLHDTFGQSYAQITAHQEGLSIQRASQLAAKGRPYIKPLVPKEYAR